MHRTSKRLVSLVIVLLLMASLAVPAFAADSAITPTTGTVVIYNSGKTSGWCNIGLAYGNKNFTINRSSVKIVSAGTTGIRLTGFHKFSQSQSNQYLYNWDANEWRSESYANYNYTAQFNFTGTGTAKVSYMIGSTTYTFTIKVLAYRNPVKSITMTGINGNKSFHSLTASSNFASKDLTFSSAVKTSIVKMTAADGWRIRMITLTDETAGSTRNVRRDAGFPSAFVYWGTLDVTHRYTIRADLYNTTYKNYSMSVTYHINGSQA